MLSCGVPEPLGGLLPAVSPGGGGGRLARGHWCDRRTGVRGRAAAAAFVGLGAAAAAGWGGWRCSAGGLDGWRYGAGGLDGWGDGAAGGRRWGDGAGAGGFG